MKLHTVISYIVFFIFFFGGIFSADANEFKHKNIQLTYDVYASSLLQAMKIDIGISVNKNMYTIDLSSKTSGFLGTVLPWSGTLFSEGTIESGSQFIPIAHSFENHWSKDKKATEMTFNQQGHLEHMIVTSTERDPYYQIFDEQITYGTTDLLSAMMTLFIQADEKKACSGARTVFDGKRRFELLFHDKGPANLNNKRYSVYAGPTMTCEVEVIPVAGKWHEEERGWMALQEQSRKNSRLPKLWLGKIDSSGPVLPVRLQIHTDFGPLTMHLTDYSRDGEGISKTTTSTGDKIR